MSRQVAFALVFAFRTFAGRENYISVPGLVENLRGWVKSSVSDTYWVIN
jgi:hypothetical protein